MLRYLMGSLRRAHNEGPNNFFLRFKETTNIGRHLVFAQYGIPVVSDMTPSACQFLEDGVTGFLAYHSDGWFRALHALACDPDRREAMGRRFQERFERETTHDVLNDRLCAFMDRLLEQRLRPSGVRGSSS